VPGSQTIDARGLRCPLPVLQAEKIIDVLPPGAVLVVLADDPVARIDIPLLCRRRGCDCHIVPDGDAISFTITKL